MCQAEKEAVWLTGLLKDYIIDLRTPPIISGDSRGALALAQNPTFHPQSKHITTQYHITREVIRTGQMTVKYIPTKVVIADAPTKSLPRPGHIAFTEMMDVYKRN